MRLEDIQAIVTESSERNKIYIAFDVSVDSHPQGLRAIIIKVWRGDTKTFTSFTSVTAAVDFIDTINKQPTGDLS
jgi:hypothetical protein